MDDIYALAYVLYNQKCYREASYFFRLLILSNPRETKFWKGLGACFQMEKEYEKALNCYKRCSYLFAHHVDPYLEIHKADCYFALKEIEKAMQSLETAYQAAKKEEDQSILQHVAFMREIWSCQTSQIG